MGTIHLKKIKVYAYHGCLLEEGQIGSDYFVDLKVKASLDRASKTDHLADTVDYVLLHKIVKEQMAIRSKLLEHVAKRILEQVLECIEDICAARVRVSKVNPPIGGNVSEVVVEMKIERKK